MAKITYRIHGQTTYADLPLNNIIYVLKGATVTFKLAGPEFGGVQMVQPGSKIAAARAVFGGVPVKQAGVQVGGLQIPTDVSATFNTASVGPTDYKDTVVSCGVTSLTARAVVFDVTVVVTPLDNFRGLNAVNDLGVDERVNLSCTIAPNPLTAVQVGGLKWKVDGATGGAQSGTVTKSATDKALPAADGLAHYVAPFKTGDLVFTGGALTPTGTSMRKNVTVSVVVDSGPSKGAKVDKVFTVHTPQAEMRDVRNQYQHEQNFPSAGFKGDIYLVPRNCSFRTLEWREGGGTATATGYFLKDRGKPHHPTGTNPSGGSFKSEVREVQGGNLVDGCWVRQIDSVWTGYNDIYPNPFGAGPHAGQATNVASTMSWKIYWQYRVAGASGESWIKFQFAEHRADMDGAGSVTISKAGTSKTFNLADATVIFP